MVPLLDFLTGASIVYIRIQAERNHRVPMNLNMFMVVHGIMDLNLRPLNLVFKLIPTNWRPITA